MSIKIKTTAQTQPSLPTAEMPTSKVPSGDGQQTVGLDQFEVQETQTTTHQEEGIETVSQSRSMGVATPLGLLSLQMTSLVEKQDSILASIDDVVSGLPDPVEKGFSEALKQSCSRILQSHERGDITLEESATSLEMMQEMLEIMQDLHTQNVTIEEHKEHDDNVDVWRVKAPDGDEMLVTTREYGSDFGEARVSFSLRKDDGKALKGRHRMAMRLDFEKFGQASVDVAFGGSALDKRIHGLETNPDGSLFVTSTGKQLAAHHFRGNLPESIQEPDSFAKLVEGFVRETMNPLMMAQQS